jgi:hypothetical protein
MSIYIRKLSLEDDHNDSVFLWGARQVGNTNCQLFTKSKEFITRNRGVWSFV